MLDPQQQHAVETMSRRALVIAGAGSGKTRVLIGRIAHLLENCQVSPYEVMGFTFTRKAAGEMRERLETAIGARAHHVTLGTMHGLALSMLRRFGEAVGLRPNNITVYGEWEESFLLREVAMELGFYKKTWKVPKKKIDAVFADYYERGLPPASFDPVTPLFEAFRARVRENNALTYGMLLHGLERLIPTMARHLHIKHILVDEVQDIDPLQWRIINGMCAAFGATLFAVGDVDQSIYAFRGAVPEYLVEHQGDFDVYLLESNYRSVPAIVEGANHLIRHNEARIGKTMRATRDGISGIVIKVNCDSEYLASFLQGFVCDSTPIQPEQVAILARNHMLLRRLDEELTTREIPHVYIGRKTALTNSEEFRRFHSFLKLIVNPYDNFSFLLIRELIGLTPQEYREIRVTAAQKGKSHFQAWVDSQHLFESDWGCFFAVAEEWREHPWEVIHELAAMDAMDHAMFLSSLDFAHEWTMTHPNGTISDYLAWLATWDIQDEVKDEPEGITLSTIHAAKGLEWPVVIVAGCNEGLLPSKQAVANGEIEEETRLFYVGMTRARDQLILAIRPERKEYLDGRVIESPVSRFVGWALT